MSLRLAKEHPNHLGDRPDPDCPKCRGRIAAVPRLEVRAPEPVTACRHGIPGRKCAACGYVDCLHPGALAHECTEARGSHA